VNTDTLPPLLDDLAAELTERDQPEWRAWRMLAPTSTGWTKRLYDASAFGAWQEIRQRLPGDLAAVHHLAIMHHARAIDLEQSEQPPRSDPDWRQALQYWRQLYEAPEFWSVLSGRVATVPDPVPGIRRELAERVLTMHFDIAADDHSPPDRGRYHVRLALDSGFPAELVEHVRHKAYEQAISGLGEVVWQAGYTDPELLGPAAETVANHLERDEDWFAALTDLLRLLVRLQPGRIRELNAMPAGDEHGAALEEFVAETKAKDRFIARLESRLLSAEEPDRLTVADLALWLGRSGQVCRAALHFGESVGYYERAQRAAHASGDPKGNEYRVEQLRSLSREASRNKRHDQAIEYMRKARDQAGSNGTGFDEDLARCLNTAAVALIDMRAGATAFLAGGAADKAVAMLEEAISLDPSPSYEESLESIQHLRHSRGYYW